jgi:hypothetical protein
VAAWSNRDVLGRQCFHTDDALAFAREHEIDRFSNFHFLGGNFATTDGCAELRLQGGATAAKRVVGVHDLQSRPLRKFISIFSPQFDFNF